MAPRSLVPSLLSGALTVAASSCTWGTGPDCPQACTLAEQCSGLGSTFLLSCSTLAGGCYDQVADCATCITSPSTTCTDLINGACDPVCLVATPDAGPGDGGP